MSVQNLIALPPPFLHVSIRSNSAKTNWLSAFSKAEKPCLLHQNTSGSMFTYKLINDFKQKPGLLTTSPDRKFPDYFHQENIHHYKNNSWERVKEHRVFGVRTFWLAFVGGKFPKIRFSAVIHHNCQIRDRKQCRKYRFPTEIIKKSLNIFLKSLQNKLMV